MPEQSSIPAPPARPSPRSARQLPIAPLAPPSARRLPIADEARPVDQAWRPVYAVWEITLRCDLACRHCGSRAGRARPDELSTAEALRLATSSPTSACAR